MADIIFFKPRERSDGLPRHGQPAAVVIFPGVRYERPEGENTSSDTPPKTGERPGRRGKRRRLS